MSNSGIYDSGDQMAAMASAQQALDAGNYDAASSAINAYYFCADLLSTDNNSDTGSRVAGI